MERNQSIDLIKIIAMILIVRMHAGINHSLAYFAPIDMLHGIISPAVPLFFMVSGFLMQSKMPDYKYIFNKIGRILRFIYIVIPISCLLTGIFEHHPRPHSLYGWFIGRGNLWQFWYFGATIILYLIAPYVCQWMASKKAHFLLAATGVICTIVVILNVYFQFEEQYTILTFRLWTWLFYFVLGAYIKQYGCSPRVNWLWVLIAMGTAGVFINTHLTPKFDYLYGSMVCAFYAYCIFCASLNTSIHKSNIISQLSALFLPVYTIHPFVYQWYEHYVSWDIYPRMQGSICFLTVLGLTFCISFILVKTPYVKNIFRL